MMPGRAAQTGSPPSGAADDASAFFIPIMQTPTLGAGLFPSPIGHTVSDDIRLPERIVPGADPGLLFEPAGPREKLFFNPKGTVADIVTCGGLCPGLNNVIRSLIFQLYHGYGVTGVFGFRGGYGGLDPSTGAFPVKLTPEYVDGIKRFGGTILGTSRGPVDIGKAVDHLIYRGINILFTVGGDGTQRGANELYQEACRRGHALSVVGIPKTIDHDVPFVSHTFGFQSAVAEAVRVIDCAHTEARSTQGGIGLVKLISRHAGFITAEASVASQDVNFVLVPEVPFIISPPAILRHQDPRGPALLHGDHAEHGGAANADETMQRHIQVQGVPKQFPGREIFQFAQRGKRLAHGPRSVLASVPHASAATIRKTTLDDSGSPPSFPRSTPSRAAPTFH